MSLNPEDGGRFFTFALKSEALHASKRFRI